MRRKKVGQAGHSKRVGVVSLYYWPARAFGGPVFANRDLCRVLAARGLEIRVVTSDSMNALAREAESEWVEVDPGVLVKYCRGIHGGLFAPGMLLSSVRLVREMNAVYVWGFFVWLLPPIQVFCWLWDVRLVVATGGMLSKDALSVRPLKKRLFLLLARLMRIGSKAVFHVTSTAEGRDVAREIPGALVEIVPLGVDVPPKEEVSALRSSGDEREQYFLVLGRLDPHKQVGRVIEAFSKALEVDAGRNRRDATDNWRWVLLIAGRGSSDERQHLESVVKASRREEDIRFMGEVYGDAKDALISRAAFLVSGSRSENFGVGIAEALARSVPVIASRGCPWPDLDARGCGWWVEGTVEGLTEAFARAMTVDSAERDRMGERGREWMRAEFGWPQLGARYETLFTGAQLASE